MSKKYILPIIILISLTLAACGEKATATVEVVAPVFTPTSDPCSPDNLPAEVARVNKLMREFDDYSSLASNTPLAQLIQIIPEMQRVLRDTEDLQVPSCLQTLKKLEMAHMNMVIQTLMAFMNSTDVKLINAGIAQARELHAKYDIEIARLLGITLTVPPSPAPALVTPDANAVPASPTIAPVATVTNPGPNGVNLRNAPDLNASEAGILAVQITTNALGRTADNLWIRVEIPDQPGQTAWVYAALVQISVPIDQLTVITP